jgi:hypothetical protein
MHQLYPHIIPDKTLVGNVIKLLHVNIPDKTLAIKTHGNLRAHLLHPCSLVPHRTSREEVCSGRRWDRSGTGTLCSWPHTCVCRWRAGNSWGMRTCSSDPQPQLGTNGSSRHCCLRKGFWLQRPEEGEYSML